MLTFLQATARLTKHKEDEAALVVVVLQPVG